MKKILIFFSIFPVTAICLGQTNQTGSLTIQTYYPAPTGVYSRIRLKPSDNAPNGTALQPGVIYYNNTTDMLMYYNKTKVWVNLTGGGSGPYWEYNTTTKVIRNTNAGKVIINGANDWGPNGTILQVHGEPRIQGKDGSSRLYLSRENGTITDVSQGIVYHSSSVANRSWVLGAVKDWSWPYSRLIVGQIKSDNYPFYHVTVLENGNVGLRSDNDTPFYDASAKLHIVGIHNGTDGECEIMRLDGNGKLGMEMSSASNNTTLGPVINGFRSRGTLASPTSVKDEDTLFGIMPAGWFGGGWFKNVGSIEIAASNNFNNTSNPAHIHFYGTNTTATDYENRLCVMHTGEVDFNYYTDRGYNLHVCVDVDCTNYGGIDHAINWARGSDGRFKKNISGIEDALEKVLRAKGIRYDSLTEKSSIAKKGRHFGFIGQDLETVMPELVDSDSQGYRSVSYEGITPVLVEAIKDQEKQIESLRQEVEALKACKKQGTI